MCLTGGAFAESTPSSAYSPSTLGWDRSAGQDKEEPYQGSPTTRWQLPFGNVFHFSQWMPSFLPLPSLLKSRFEAPSHNPPHPPPTLDIQTCLSPVYIKAEAINQPDFVSCLELQIVLSFSAGERKNGYNLLADFWCSPEKGFIGALLKAKPTRVSTLSNLLRQLSCL